jgi:hypothetical protein
MTSAEQHNNGLVQWVMMDGAACRAIVAAVMCVVTAGMSVARLNMSHGSHESHKAVIDLVQAYNETGRGCVATMLDTKVMHRQAALNAGFGKAANN